MLPVHGLESERLMDWCAFRLDYFYLSILQESACRVF
jgi:hypothetical protein